MFYVTIKRNGFEKINWHKKRAQYNDKKARNQNSYMPVNITSVYKCGRTRHKHKL